MEATVTAMGLSEEACKDERDKCYIDGWCVLPSKVMDLKTLTTRGLNDVYTKILLGKMNA